MAKLAKHRTLFALVQKLIHNWGTVATGYGGRGCGPNLHYQKFIILSPLGYSYSPRSITIEKRTFNNTRSYHIPAIELF